VIEAQACGCRVVTSDRTPLTEIGGDSAVYADPENPDALASAAVGLFAEPSAERRFRIDRGLRNAATFSAERMIEKYAALYHSLLEGQPTDMHPASPDNVRKVAASALS